jgi:hypothetical protein
VFLFTSKLESTLFILKEAQLVGVARRSSCVYRIRAQIVKSAEDFEEKG